MNDYRKFSLRVAEVDGKYLRLDGFGDEPMNFKRSINITKFCTEIHLAKNFFKYPEDIAPTKQALPNAKFYDCNITLVIDSKTNLPF